MSIRDLGLRFLGLLSLGLLAACANPAADASLYAQGALIGMPKQTLLSCAGVPDKQAVIDNQEFFTYHSGQITSYPSASFGVAGGRWGWGSGIGYGYGAGYPGYDVQSTICEATFTLRNGVVERLVYSGAPGGRSTLGQCYYVVQNCLALIPQQTPPKP